ncbi:MAG: cupin domain-containing protein [Firmicutes bacterium]|nr:cupin domain-containing protein [Bacillota bacterium]
MIKELSKKIRKLRNNQKMTLKDMSKKTNLSVSFLSQVERGESSIAITSLKKIADALDVSITDFFEEKHKQKFTRKKDDQQIFKLEGSNTEYIRLSGDFSKRTMETLLVQIAPNEKHGTKFTHPGEEFVYVLEGAIIVNLEGEEVLLKAGESIHYPSEISHYWVNPLNQKSKVLSVLSVTLF